MTPPKWDLRRGDVLSAVSLELNIECNGFYGPPSPRKPEPKRELNLSLKAEHKYLGKYETLTCTGKSWRNYV